MAGKGALKLNLSAIWEATTLDNQEKADYHKFFSVAIYLYDYPSNSISETLLLLIGDLI